jgi:hypothetical protein
LPENHTILFFTVHICISRETVGQNLHSLVTQLCDRVAHLHFWAANGMMVNRDIPSQLEHTVLTKPLRYSPAMLRQLRPMLANLFRKGLIGSDATSFTSMFPAVGEGADVIMLHHHGDDHTGPYPMDCERCGRNVSVKLRQIGVGPKGKIEATEYFLKDSQHCHLQCVIQ